MKRSIMAFYPLTGQYSLKTNSSISENLLHNTTFIFYFLKKDSGKQTILSELSRRLRFFGGEGGTGLWTGVGGLRNGGGIE